jgi:hypothetical protein
VTADPSVEALRSNPALGRMAAALASGDGFQFYVIISPSAQTADAALDLVAELMASRRSSPIQIERFDPSRARTDLPPHTSAEAAMEAVLEPLLAGRQPAHERLVVVDASRAVPEDAGSWSLRFEAINERLDLIGERVDGPLLLLLPFGLEGVFAHAAPELWSRARLVARAGKESSTPDEAALPEGAASAAGRDRPGSASALRALIVDARSLLRASPDDLAAQENLARLLIALGSVEASRGRTEEAAAQWREALGILDPLLQRSEPLPARRALADEARAALNRLSGA